MCMLPVWLVSYTEGYAKVTHRTALSLLPFHSLRLCAKPKKLLSYALMVFLGLALCHGAPTRHSYRHRPAGNGKGAIVMPPRPPPAHCQPKCNLV